MASGVERDPGLTTTSCTPHRSSSSKNAPQEQGAGCRIGPHRAPPSLVCRRSFVTSARVPQCPSWGRWRGVARLAGSPRRGYFGTRVFVSGHRSGAAGSRSVDSFRRADKPTEPPRRRTPTGPSSASCRFRRTPSSATLPSTMPQPAYTQPTSPSNTPVRSATETRRCPRRPRSRSAREEPAVVRFDAPDQHLRLAHRRARHGGRGMQIVLHRSQVDAFQHARAGGRAQVLSWVSGRMPGWAGTSTS